MDCLVKKTSSQSLNALVQQLKRHGLRVTEQRQNLLDFLLQAKQALTIQEIYMGLMKKKVRVDEASVYRSVHVLKNIHLLHELDNGAVSLCLHTECKDHIHMSWLCEKCGQIQEPKMKDKDLEKLQSLLGFKSNHISHVKINYLCKNCR